MEFNLPEDLYEDYSAMGRHSASGVDASLSRAPPTEDMMREWINDLQVPNARASALQKLADNRNYCDALPRLLSEPAPIAVLLQEVIGVYPELSRPIMSQNRASRTYNALLLFQVIASHPLLKVRLLRAMIPHYLYPILDSRYVDKQREYLRLGSLGVLAHLLKANDYGAAARIIIDTDGVGSCVYCIETSSMLSRTLAAFTLLRILDTDEGLQYCCVLAERYFKIDNALKQTLIKLATRPNPSPELFQLIISCYLRLSTKPRACGGMRRFLPLLLLDNTFVRLFATNPLAIADRNKLLQNLKSRDR